MFINLKLYCLYSNKAETLESVENHKNPYFQRNGSGEPSVSHFSKLIISDY
jgi:hypothetical protein